MPQIGQTVRADEMQVGDVFGPHASAVLGITRGRAIVWTPAGDRQIDDAVIIQWGPGALHRNGSSVAYAPTHLVHVLRGGIDPARYGIEVSYGS